MGAHTEAALEARLARARRLVFSADEAEAAEAEREVARVRDELRPYWDARAAKVEAAASEKLLRRWA